MRSQWILKNKISFLKGNFIRIRITLKIKWQHKFKSTDCFLRKDTCTWINTFMGYGLCLVQLKCFFCLVTTKHPQIWSKQHAEYGDHQVASSVLRAARSSGLWTHRPFGSQRNKDLSGADMLVFGRYRLFFAFLHCAGHLFCVTEEELNFCFPVAGITSHRLCLWWQCEQTSWRLPWMSSVTCWCTALLDTGTSQHAEEEDMALWFYSYSIVLDWCPCAQPCASVSVK